MINEKKLKDRIENEIRWLYDSRSFNKQTIDMFVAGLRKAIKDSIEDEDEKSID